MAKGVKSAEVWVEVAKTETAVLCGIFAPWYLMLGLSCAKCGLFYVRNKDAVNKAVDVAPTVLKQLERLRAKHPTLFKKLQAQATQEIVSELKQGHGVTPEDVAFFLGRVIHGAAGAPEITLGVLLKITTKVALLVSAAHGPSIVAHAAMSAANRRAEDLRAYLTSLGYTVSLQEAAQIIRELSSDPSALLNLQELSNALRALLPSLQILQKAYGAS